MLFNVNEFFLKADEYGEADNADMIINNKVNKSDFMQISGSLSPFFSKKNNSEESPASSPKNSPKILIKNEKKEKKENSNKNQAGKLNIFSSDSEEEIETVKESKEEIKNKIKILKNKLKNL